MSATPVEETNGEQDEVREEPEVQLFAAERLAFFSDAVVAIAITLLALDLDVPNGPTMSAVLDSVGGNLSSYLGFLISFFIIANVWTSHHTLYQYIVRADTRMVWINLLWLLMVILAPFFTRVIVDDGIYYRFRFASYAGLQVLLGLLMIRMVSYARRGDLLIAATPPRVLIRLRQRALIVVIPFAVSIVAVFIPGIGQSAYAIWWVGPIAMGLSLQVRRRLRDRAARNA